MTQTIITHAIAAGVGSLVGLLFGVILTLWAFPVERFEVNDDD